MKLENCLQCGNYLVAAPESKVSQIALKCIRCQIFLVVDADVRQPYPRAVITIWSFGADADWARRHQ